MKDYVAGIDIGSAMTKVVIMDEEIVASRIVATSPEQRKLANKVMEDVLSKAKISLFAEHEVVAKLADGVALPDIIAGIHEAMARRIYGMARRIKIERDVAITGGGAKNIGLVAALRDIIGCPVLLPEEPLLTGAIGAALIAYDVVKAPSIN